MHRSTLLSTRFWWGLLFAVLLHTQSSALLAQEQIQPVPEALQVLVVPVDTTKTYAMKGEPVIKAVNNENPKVVKVSTLPDSAKAVAVTGINPGTSRVTFTNVDGGREVVEVRVPSDIEAKREKLVKLIRDRVPTAVVDVVPINESNSVLVTGTVPDTETVQIILELARGVFSVPLQQGTAGPAGVSGLANIINGMRIGGVQQVQLEVVVALVNRTETRKMSFSWVANGDKFFVNSVFGAPITTGSLAFSALGIPSLASSVTADPNINFAIVNYNSAFKGFLSALRIEGIAKVLAEPRIVTLSGRPAAINSGGEAPYVTISQQGPAVAWKPFGTVVNFLPIVLGNGKIHLEVSPQLSNINDAIGITIPGAFGTTRVPGFDNRSAQVTVQMEDGQTLAIGGLIQNRMNSAIEKVPVLGDLPWLGVLFSNKTLREEEEELLILVTPRLVDPMNCTQLPKYLPGRETRPPNDYELFLEGIGEAPRGPRNIALHPKLYTGAHVNAPNAGLYPCYDGRGNGGCATGHCGPNGCAIAPQHPAVLANSLLNTPATVGETATATKTKISEQPAASPANSGVSLRLDDSKAPAMLPAVAHEGEPPLAVPLAPNAVGTVTIPSLPTSSGPGPFSRPDSN